MITGQLPSIENLRHFVQQQHGQGQGRSHQELEEAQGHQVQDRGKPPGKNGGLGGATISKKHPGKFDLLGGPFFQSFLVVYQFELDTGRNQPMGRILVVQAPRKSMVEC